MDDGYDWDERLIHQDEEQLYEAIMELWPTGEVAQDKLSFLSYVFYGVLHVNKDIEYPYHFYQHELGKVLILDEC